MLQVCLNGALRRHEHPSVPITPAELAADAVRCEAVGANAVHLHPRDDDERESLAASAVDAAVAAIRRACPELPLGVTTGAWIEPDPDARVAAVRSWTELPDYASVNVHEDGAERVAAALHERGIGVEAGIWSAADVEVFRSWRTPALRVLLECTATDEDAALAEAGQMLAALASRQVPVLLHGAGVPVWAVVREAVRCRVDTRVGLEDTIDLPDGTLAPGNAALVTMAAAYGAR
jgi:uncharacterized protein (DUF849 family)